MCPEFLREGSGIADFYAPPFLVVGTADPRVAETVTACSASSSQPVRVVDVRTAEALKYACNAFHATKVSFANEVSRLFRLLGVDSREVMSLFCEDQVLNISPAYLRPGFAFGGSCLPKDLQVPAAPGPGERRGPAAAGGHAGHERAGDQRGGGPGGRGTMPGPSPCSA